MLNYLAPGGGCEVLFSPGLSVCVCVWVCVSVCPANILVFYFSAIRRDIDLKFIQDTYMVVLNSLKYLQRSRSQGRNLAFWKYSHITKTIPWKNFNFFSDTSLDTLFDERIKTGASREMASPKIRQYLTLTCKTPIPKLLTLIQLSIKI